VQDLFGFVTYPMELGVIWLAVAVGSAGIGIILFTIVVRLVLSPLQIVQLRNAKSMQRVAPLVNEVRQKHGKDRAKQQEEIMKLYKEHNVNPALGCLPTLLQFPILIGLFYALLHLGNNLPDKFPHLCNGFNTLNKSQWYQHCYAVKGSSGTTLHAYDLFHANFLWLSQGLGNPDPLYILPILAGVTQWVQSRMMLTKSTDPQQQMMNTMMNFLPLMIVFFATRYASGLSLYWVTSTLIGIAIQYRITGLGLLPDTLRSITGRGAVIKSAGKGSNGGRSTAGANGNKGTRAAKTVQSAPPVEMNGVDGSGANGVSTDGVGDEPTKGNTAVIRPRKKANRARGGRGGRRG
jgi:YidC/Oxa1 family membrane protein insertase